MESLFHQFLTTSLEPLANNSFSLRASPVLLCGFGLIWAVTFCQCILIYAACFLIPWSRTNCILYAEDLVLGNPENLWAQFSQLYNKHSMCDEADDFSNAHLILHLLNLGRRWRRVRNPNCVYEQDKQVAYLQLWFLPAHPQKCRAF